MALAGWSTAIGKFSWKSHVKELEAVNSVYQGPGGVGHRSLGNSFCFSSSLLLSASSLVALLTSGHRSRAQMRSRRRSISDTRQQLPRCVVFDLDGCLWSPEMYELSWERGGAPFVYDAHGVMRDRKGCVISLHSGVDQALTEMSTDRRWQGVTVAVASCCDVPPWAFELLGKFEFGPSKSKLNEIISISKIHKGGKQGHLREIQEVVGCNFDEMIFFDNEPYNCQQVSGLSILLGIQQHFVALRNALR